MLESEQEVEQLGFDLIKSYHHDEFYTTRFKKGIIQIEFTYEVETNKQVSVDATIEETIGKVVSFHELIVLDLILNKQ